MNEQESAQFLTDVEMLGEGLALASAQVPTHARMYQRVFERMRERAVQLINGEAAMQQKLDEAAKTIAALTPKTEAPAGEEAVQVVTEEAKGG